VAQNSLVISAVEMAPKRLMERVVFLGGWGCAGLVDVAADTISGERWKAEVSGGSTDFHLFLKLIIRRNTGVDKDDVRWTTVDVDGVLKCRPKGGR
jgi:hypothetical protein